MSVQPYSTNFGSTIFLFLALADASNGSNRPPINQFSFMPELELETMFELERDCSDSSSTANKDEQSNSQPFQQPPGKVNGSDTTRQLKQPDPDPVEENHVTLKSGNSSVQCDVVVTVEPPVKNCDQVVVLLEDDESLYNKDLTDYQETAL